MDSQVKNVDSFCGPGQSSKTNPATPKLVVPSSRSLRKAKRVPSVVINGDVGVK